MFMFMYFGSGNSSSRPLLHERAATQGIKHRASCPDTQPQKNGVVLLRGPSFLCSAQMQSREGEKHQGVEGERQG